MLSTISITQKLPVSDVQNLLVSAFDPAVASTSYWCKITGYKEPLAVLHLKHRLDPEGEVYRYADYPVNEGGAIHLEIEADEDDKDNGKKYSLGFIEIVKGLSIMAEKYPRHFADILSDNDDGETADVFVQCCLFGEVIYG